jgi:glycosyltransferase involved in cell wall biosynthesis
VNGARGETPRISVLMPVRDAAPWLPEALASISAQTEEQWELIAVDDGSTDASRAMLERWAARDRRVRVLWTGPCRRGIVAALETALRAARAPLSARMDADDVAHPERLAAQAQALDADPTLFAVACRVGAFPARNVRDGMRRYLAWQNGLLAAEELLRDRFVETPVLHPSVMMRTGVLRSTLGGWSDAPWPEDWDLFLRAFEAGLRITRLPRELLRWRLHDSQTTRVDPRYSQASLCDARAYFLARTLADDPREVWVMGAGPTGKSLGKALARERAAVTGFAEVDPRKIGGRIRDGERCWPVVSMSDLVVRAPRPIAVAAVGRREARERIRGDLDARGWREGTDYFVAA